MKTIRLLFVAVFLVFGFGSCQYTFWLEEEVLDPDDPDVEEVSFSETIQPIFTSKCVACHTTGKQIPDLSEGNAYSSINSSRYINTSTPEESLIYTYISPDTDTHSQAKYTAAQAANVLIWITQGAQNN